MLFWRPVLFLRVYSLKRTVVRADEQATATTGDEEQGLDSGDTDIKEASPPGPTTDHTEKDDKHSISSNHSMEKVGESEADDATARPTTSSTRTKEEV